MKRIYFVGICGIGMSGIAQAFHSLGYEVAGSDREISPNGANAELLCYFRELGVKIYPQDGSFLESFKPDLIVYSTAIEDGNPDFRVSAGIQRLHRSEALRTLLELGYNGKVSIAITGTNGKTTVSSWLADSLYELGLGPIAIIGGYVAKFAKLVGSPGNFFDGGGKYFVFEADESDKSILNYSPDYVVILNTGADHYDIEEQNRVFAKFAKSARKGVIVLDELKDVLDVNALVSFGRKKIPGRHIFLKEYIKIFDKKVLKPEIVVDVLGVERKLRLPLHGEHNAMNACAVLAVLSELCAGQDFIHIVEKFEGVERRFMICGRGFGGALIVDDYAHNPDKIGACIRTAQEIAQSGRVIFIFQPHGYGPLGFMKDALKEVLRKTLRNNDRFIFLPVFYAGGTTSFKPSSEEVVAYYREFGLKNCEFRISRVGVEDFLKGFCKDGDVVVIAGARDGTLSKWAKSMVIE